LIDGQSGRPLPEFFFSLAILGRGA